MLRFQWKSSNGMSRIKYDEWGSGDLNWNIEIILIFILFFNFIS